MTVRSIRNKAHWAAYATVVTLAVGVFVAAWSARQDRLWGDMQEAAHEAAREVGLSTRSARNSVFMLQGVANGLFQQQGLALSKEHQAALAERLDLPGTTVLLPITRAAHHTARASANNHSDSPAFSMAGVKPAPDSEAGLDKGREIEIALSLGPALIQAKTTQSAAAAVYYLSGQGFHLIYPPASDDLQLFTPDMLARDPYRDGLVERNPGRTPVWSASYDDPKGNGLISTLAIPIDDAEGRYRAIAAMDFQLDSLSQYVRRPALGIATAFILDDRDRVIAHPTMVGGASDKAPTLQQVAQRAGAGDWSALRTAPANNRQELAADWALVYDIESTPWRYAIVVDRAQLRWAALRTMPLEAGALAALLLLLGYAEKRRREALVSLRRKAAEDVLQAAPAPVAVLRQADLSIMMANAALLRLFGDDGTTDAASARRSAHEQLHDLIKSLSSQEQIEAGRVSEMCLHRDDSTPFWVLVRCVPLVHEDEPGWLCSLTEVTALKQAQDQLETLATTDPLTGALNRRAIAARGGVELKRVGRTAASFSVLLLDIDLFKRVNDEHGHPAGDRVLQAVSRACQGALRELDVFGRWGGEEFVALLPDTDHDGAVAAAERLRVAIEALSVEDDVGRPIRPTVSVGVAVVLPAGDSLEALLSRADTALYVAKAAGRNRVCVAPAGNAPAELVQAPAAQAAVIQAASAASMSADKDSGVSVGA
ncbi:diguanylate cyclase [Rhizobacter sp. OV335]|uniref:sensor domain-containing diguanylate cyclase n=1 Tax=Rhizobacter sp. OV335 TaxID=1500264 RepID=UPI000921C919|nr:diguanylate cyclase [Rhizobacter sp. OV335]SHM12015.1 diguanylate cyclase (GGDEF) domain-containing protein [Rhizobacter sp. OV335]